MNRFRILLIAFFTTVAGLSPAPVSAELSLEYQLEHEGLTFATPLAISYTPTPLLLTQIEFGIEPQKTIAKPTQSFTASKIRATTIPQKKVLVSQVQASPNTEKLQPTQRLTPTKTPTTPPSTPTQTPSPTVQPTPHIASFSTAGGLDPEKLFSMSNEFRASKGLPPFQKDERTCALASSRAPEIAAEVAEGRMHAGLRARNLDYWNTENIISMRTEESAFNWWINDKIHYDAIVSDNTFSCVACHGNSCAQEFTKYQPK